MCKKTFILLWICCFSTISHAETADTTIYALVRQSIETPTKNSAISAFNQIINNRNLNLPKTLSFETIKQYILDDEIVIELFAMPMIDGRIEYVAFIVRKEYGMPHVFKLFDETELDREMGKGDALYRDTIVATMLLKPLLGELSGVKKIFFTPAGKLHLFAIEYCNAGGGQMLSGKYEFFRLTSSAMLVHRNDKHVPYKSYVIYGGIDFESPPDFEETYEDNAPLCRMGYLKDSYLAAKEIHNFLKSKGISGELFANESATELSFKACPWHDIQLFFIETHGVSYLNQYENTFPNALMLAGSSYVMSGGIVHKGKEDGLLTTDEIAEMDLASVDLAVISACKSALGEVDDQGVDGLMRAFKTAGVNSLVMTTDDVVDYVSGEVWKVFFKNIANGMSKRESLFDAVKYARSMHDGFYAAPKYWTPFILIDGLD